MPTYEYRCPKGHEFEKFYRSISAAPGEAFCPMCGKVTDRRDRWSHGQECAFGSRSRRKP